MAFSLCWFFTGGVPKTNWKSSLPSRATVHEPSKVNFMTSRSPTWTSTSRKKLRDMASTAKGQSGKKTLWAKIYSQHLLISCSHVLDEIFLKASMVLHAMTSNGNFWATSHGEALGLAKALPDPSAPSFCWWGWSQSIRGRRLKKKMEKYKHI